MSSATLETFKKTVASAGTAEPLSSTRLLTPSFVVRALPSDHPSSPNTGYIYVGSSTSAGVTNGMPLSPGESNEKAARFTRYGVHKLWDLSKIYIDAQVSGEGVIVEYEVK